MEMKSPLQLIIYCCCLLNLSIQTAADDGLLLEDQTSLRERLELIANQKNQSNITSVERIVGGKVVPNGGAPHQIALHRTGTFICGGSLIASRTVVTAAHCVYG